MQLKHAIQQKWKNIIKRYRTKVNPKLETVFIKLSSHEKPAKILQSKQIYFIFEHSEDIITKLYQKLV